LVKKLLAAGLNRKNIRILVATGLHRPNEGHELREVVGDDWVFENIIIQNHFARNDEDHVDLGHTRLGTRVLLDKRLVEADLRIVVGLVEPHFMAGFSGGRKLIMPGVAHERTITYLHNARFMGDLRACNGNLEGNPLHEQQLEIVKMLDGAQAVNLVIDEHRRVAFVNFGEIIRSHLLAVEFIRPYVEVEVPHAFQTVLTSGGGYPLDKTYYQTVKGMVAAMDILAPGGELFIVSEISEGMGSREYLKAQQNLMNLGSEGFLHSIKDRPHAAIDAWQTQKQLEPMRKGKIFLYTSGLNPVERRFTGIQMVKDLQAELFRSVSRHKQLAVIPEGPYVMPFVAG
jgi:nickel-dependent lactate racemase